MDKIVLLLRFMKQEYVASFLRGELYLNSLEYFAALEGDGVRSDTHEGAHFAFQAAKVEIADEKGQFTALAGFINPITYRQLTPSGINLLSMYAVRTAGIFQVDERNFAFGDSAVVIRNPGEFFAKVERAVHKLGRKLRWQPVDYMPRSYEGPIGPFRKLADFEYQQELRLAVSGGDGARLQLAIGDISDICEVHPALHFRLGVVSAEAP